MVFGWLSRTSSTSYVCSVLCQDNGIETPSDGVSPVVESQNINVTVSSSSYIVNGYRKIGLSLNSQNLPALITMGVSSGIFTLSGGSWTKVLIDVEGINNGIVVKYISVDFSVDTKISIATDSGDIYYFEPGAGSTFPLSTPSVFILNELWVYRTTYSNGSLSGIDISGTYDNMAGGILTDAQKPLLIVSNKSTPATTTTTTTTSP